MQDKTALGISEELRQFIEALIEEVILEGKPFESQIKYLPHFCHAEDVDYSMLETNLAALFEAVEELKVHESKGTERLLQLLAKECHISHDEINKIISDINTKRLELDTTQCMMEEKERIEKELQRANREKDNQIAELNNQIAELNNKIAELEKWLFFPIILIWTILGIISIAEIIAIGWWGIIPLFVNVFVGGQAFEKWEKGELKAGFLFRGGILVVVVFLFTYFLHWWSLLLIPLAIFFILSKDDIE